LDYIVVRVDHDLAPLPSDVERFDPDKLHMGKVEFLGIREIKLMSDLGEASFPEKLRKFNHKGLLLGAVHVVQ
jgi:hypothetical protein